MTTPPRRAPAASAAAPAPAARLGAAPGPEVPPVVEMVGVTKAFGPTLANAEVSLAIAPGDVFGLVGGNGAGKSTLMRILCGLVAPDRGAVRIEGREIDPETYGAAAAHRLGIRIVHQELSLCGNLTVAENFYLEVPAAARWRPGWRRPFRARARQALDRVFPGHGIDPDQAVDDLPIGERQMVEIARALSAPGVRLVILDEPTSSLGLDRSRQLRAFVGEQARSGLAFIFISHKLHEVIDIATRIAVLRNGRLVRETPTAEASVPLLIELMGGEGAAAAAARGEAAPAPPGDVLVSLSGPLCSAVGPSVELRRGEIVGLAGLEGSGPKEVLQAVFAGRGARADGVERRAEAAFISGDRQKDGVFPLWSVLDNIALGRTARMPFHRPVAMARLKAALTPLAAALRLDPARLPSPILDLSGGNQQKALVARALAADAPVLLLDDPTRGVDVAAKRDFYALVASVAREGRLVLWHSTEDLEFLECDRVLVFSGGRIARELGREAISERAIVDASFEQPPGPGLAAPGRGSRLGGAALRVAFRAAPFVSLALVFGAMVLANPATATGFGLDLLLTPALPLVLVALGQMFVVGGSEIDLGIGAFAGLANVLSATWLIERPASGVPGLLAGLLVYALLGALVQWRRIPAIVVTLGASFVWTGIGYTLQPTPGGASPEWLTGLFALSIPGLPTSLAFIVVVALVAAAIDRTPLGVALRGFGNNPEAMVRSGWRPAPFAALRYGLAGLFGLAAGLSLTAINTASDINAGRGYTLLSVAAVVIGGCGLLGGLISPLGVAAGAVTLSLVGALLGMFDVPPEFNAAVQGLLLLAILALRSAAGWKRAAA